MDVKQALRRMKHGGQIHRLTLGTLPDVMGRELWTARRYRRDLEQRVVEVKGEVSLTDAHWIDEATAAEVHAAINHWLMRTKLEKMTPSDISRCSAEIMKAKTTRNKAFERLGLDKIEENTIDALYNVIPEHPTTAPQTPGEATEPDSPVNTSATSDCEDCLGEGCPTCGRNQNP